MPEIDESRQERRLRVQTTRGCLEGRIQTGPMVRTLDDLNVVARNLVTLHGARALTGDWSLESGSVALAKSAILYAFELDEPAHAARTGRHAATVFSVGPASCVVAFVEDVEVTRMIPRSPAVAAADLEG